MAFRNHWNTRAERRTLDELLAHIDDRLEDESSSSSSSAMSVVSDRAMNVILSSSSSESSDDSLDEIIDATTSFGEYIYDHLLDTTIDFKAPRILIEDLEAGTCIDDFRFRKGELQDLADRLWPKMSLKLEGAKEKIKCSNRLTAPYETGLLLVIYRLASPHRISPEMERYFSMRQPHITCVIYTFLDALFSIAEEYLTDASLYLDRMELYSELIHDKCGGAITHVWGFIDGTLREICRPTYDQRVAYSGHKRCHGVKFQSVVTPDGLIAMMHGPFEGCRHDSTILTDSKLLVELEILMPGDDGFPIHKIYGDPAYPMTIYMCKPFTNPPAGSDRAKWNAAMSSVRQSVEWGFKEISSHWRFMNVTEEMKVFKIPVAKFYMCAAFLTNLRTCYYGNQTSLYFDDDARMTIDEYLALVE